MVGLGVEGGSRKWVGGVWMSGLASGTMGLAYEARVAVRGELASPKSFSQADTPQQGRQR